jgi:fructose-1,6-bisphosphatase II
MYMEKLAGGSDIADLLDLDKPVETMLGEIAERRTCDIRDIMVVTLDRPRHEQRIKEIRDAGARVRLIVDGDVSASQLAVSDRSPVTLLWGIGGTPEGVISAAAIKAIGGGLVGRLWPRDDDERKAALDGGYDLDKQHTQDDLVRGGDCFFSATGVTDGDVLQGVRYHGTTASTESIVMRSRTGTVRRVHARHNREKLRAMTGARYG